MAQINDKIKGQLIELNKKVRRVALKELNFHMNHEVDPKPIDKEFYDKALEIFRDEFIKQKV